MKHKCDKCDRPATHHSIEILGGKKLEKHLCDLHAAEDGLAVKSVQTPINELLTNFVKLQTKDKPAEARDITCDNCGLTFAKFREKSLLGCPHCYDAFERALIPLLERAQEGASQHVGKVPKHAGTSDQRQILLTRMRKRLDDAVTTEDYELAARLRDEINRLQEKTTE